MELIINDKTFVCRYKDKQKLVVTLDNILDIRFFKEWEDKKTIVKLKKDYVKDIRIITNHEIGMLINCLPCLNLNEDEVIIVYDWYDERKWFDTRIN